MAAGSRGTPCTWPRGLPAHRQAPSVCAPGNLVGGRQRQGRDQRAGTAGTG